MPKMKTKASAKKRFKISASGKIRRKHAYKSHNLACKSKRQKRCLTGFSNVKKCDEKNIKLTLVM